VPKFVAVQGLPFLLYSKPQSPALGGVLRKKVAWELKKWDQRNKLNEESIPLGDAEDAWDSFVALQAEQERRTNNTSTAEASGNKRNPFSESWSSAAHNIEATIGEQIRKFNRKNLETSRRMVEVLKQERVLAAKEKAELQSQKCEQRAAKRADRFPPAV
jgi:tRNA A37 threonylcarbamoyladenosine dehydratase